MKRYIITGPPDAGRISIFNALRDQGYGVFDEAASTVVSERQALGIEKPWLLQDFIDSVTETQRQHRRRESSNKLPIEFHDGSAVCTHALSVYLQQSPPKKLREEIERINQEEYFERQVFRIATTNFPGQMHADLFKTSGHEMMFDRLLSQTYQEFGYELIDILGDSASSQVKGILNVVSILGHSESWNSTN